MSTPRLALLLILPFGIRPPPACRLRSPHLTPTGFTLNFTNTSSKFGTHSIRSRTIATTVVVGKGIAR